MHNSTVLKGRVGTRTTTMVTQQTSAQRTHLHSGMEAVRGQPCLPAAQFAAAAQVSAVTEFCAQQLQQSPQLLLISAIAQQTHGERVELVPGHDEHHHAHQAKSLAGT